VTEWSEVISKMAFEAVGLNALLLEADLVPYHGLLILDLQGHTSSLVTTSTLMITTYELRFPLPNLYKQTASST
jgi:hypothetical protein